MAASGQVVTCEFCEEELSGVVVQCFRCLDRFCARCTHLGYCFPCNREVDEAGETGEEEELGDDPVLSDPEPEPDDITLVAAYWRPSKYQRGK